MSAKVDTMMSIDQFYSPEDLKRLQDTVLDILKRFDAFCKEQGLEYVALYGTVLGAIRHGGMIPWDDDIDIGMPRKDYDRLPELVPQFFDKGFSFVSGDTEPRYPFRTSRIMKDGTEFRVYSMKDCPFDLGIFLDIFCLDDIPDEGFKRKMLIFRAWCLEKMIIVRNLGYVNSPFSGAKKKIFDAFCTVAHVLLKVVSPAFLQRRFRKVLTKYQGDPDCHWIGMPCGFKAYWNMYPKSMVYPLQTMAFEDMEIPMPNDPQGMMEIVYGPDYMTPPPPGKRNNIVPYKLSFGDEKDEA